MKTYDMLNAGLIYHPHFRPLTTPIAALLDLSATVHARAPPSLPTPSKVLRALGSAQSAPISETGLPSALHAVANAMVIPPIHVDHVAEAICVAAEGRENVRGVADVREMRKWIGWAEKGQMGDVHASHG